MSNDRRDEFLQGVQEKLDRGEIQIIYTLTDDENGSIPFAYTIGLSAKIGHEVVIAGLDQQTSAAVLNAVQAFAKSQSLPDNERVPGVLDDLDVSFIPVLMSESAPLAVMAHELLGPVEFKAILFPDRENNLPWDDQCEQGLVEMTQAIYPQSLANAKDVISRSNGPALH